MRATLRGTELALGRRRERCLLGLLLLDAGRTVPTDRLIDLLWDGEAPASASASVHTHVSRLRRLLDPDRDGRRGVRLDAVDSGYRIEVDAGSVDVNRFTADVRSARDAQDPARRAELLRAALGLWRGPLLADCASDVLRQRISVTLDELRMTAIELANDADLARGRHRELVGPLTDLTARHPLHETFWAQLALALYRADRQADALAALDTARRHLADELGIDPGQRLTTLHQRILKADPALHPAAATPAAQRQLPMDIAEFTGREAELATLLATGRSASEDDTGTAVRICAIVGMGGVGKTRLAIRAAHRLTRDGLFADVQLWADLHGFHPAQPPTDPAVVLDRFLRTLGVQAHDVPDGVEERAGLYRARLNGRRALVLLDDAAGDEQLAPLLPGTPGSLVLITSRHSLTGLDGVTSVPLEVFTSEEAIELVTREAGAARVAADLAAVERVVELCGHLPLAVAMAGRQLRNRPSWQPGDLAERLADDDRRLTQLSRHDRAVRPTFELSYRSLDADHQRLFRLLGLFPGDDFTAPAVAALAGVDLVVAESALELMLDEHLLQQPARDRYRMHDLVRLHSTELTRHTDSPDARQAAFVRLVEHYLGRAEQATIVLHPTETRRLARRPCRAPVFATPSAAVAWVEEEFVNLLAIVARAAEGTDDCARLALRLVRALHRPLANRGHSSDRIALNQLAVRTARQLGDRWSEAMALEDLGTLCGQVGLTKQAAEYTSAALELWTELDDAAGRQGCLADLGNLHRQDGRLEEAADCLERGLDIARRSGSRSGEASLLNFLGLVHQRARRFAEAADCLARSSEIYAELGNDLGVAIALANLAWARQRAGEPAQALEEHGRALAIFRGLHDRYNEAEQLWGIGRAHHALGHAAEAQQSWHEAIGILREIGLLDSAAAAALARQDVPETPEIIELNT